MPTVNLQFDKDHRIHELPNDCGLAFRDIESDFTLTHYCNGPIVITKLIGGSPYFSITTVVGCYRIEIKSETETESGIFCEY